MTKPIIAIDADGVLLDYNLGYAHAWAKAFGEFPVLKNPKAYWHKDRWGIPHLEGERLVHFRAQFDENFWGSLSALSGVARACELLVESGYELVCVSAIDREFEGARMRNLQQLNLPVTRVIATGSKGVGESPKAAAIRALSPVAFVDDYLPYFDGVADSTHAALILREPEGSPNVGELLNTVHSKHVDLLSFAQWWVGRDGRG